MRLLNGISRMPGPDGYCRDGALQMLMNGINHDFSKLGGWAMGFVSRRVGNMAARVFILIAIVWLAVGYFLQDLIWRWFHPGPVYSIYAQCHAATWTVIAPLVLLLCGCVLELWARCRALDKAKSHGSVEEDPLDSNGKGARNPDEKQTKTAKTKDGTGSILAR